MATTSMLPAFPLLVLYGFQPVSETPSAGIRPPDTILSGISNPLAGCNGDGSPDGNDYCDREHWKHGVLLSEDTNSVPV